MKKQKQRITKNELIDMVAEKTWATKKEVWQILDAIVESIMEWVKKTWEVRLQWFGVFKISHRRARNWKNPKTWEPLKIPAMKLPVFKAWIEFKNMIEK